MKKLYTLSLLLLGMAATFAQTFYSENFGTPASNTPAGEYTGYQNGDPIIYTGDATVRTTAASSGYTEASGSGNVYFGDAQTFMVEGINTSEYSAADLVLTFGQNQQSLPGEGSTTAENFVIEVSTNGTDFTQLDYSREGTGWALVTIDGGVIPSTANLRIRFTRNSASQYRIDDLKLSAVSASCTLVLGMSETACDGSTLGTDDTFTITIPFTGGGSATYNIVASAGTIGGDNPSAMAEGNITISGVTEGTDVTVEVTGGTCNLSANVTGVLCKPVNALPYYESFEYEAGTLLGSLQKWSTANSGDDIAVATGNLSYTDLPASEGNSISFSGAGMEAYTPFTLTNSGTVYSSFLFDVTDMSNITTDLTETHFAVLVGANTEGVTNPSAYRVRLFLKKVGEQYQLGLASASSTTNYTTTSYNVGETVFVIMGYDFATQTLSAWINPTISTLTTSTPATLTETLTEPLADLAGFLIRQDNDTKTPTMTFDELRIGTTLESVTEFEPAGIADNAIAGLKMYPNPLSGNILNITSDSNTAKAVEIYNILGKQVLNTVTSNGTVNVNLEAGVYIVKITEGSKTATKKLVVR